MLQVRKLKTLPWSLSREIILKNGSNSYKTVLTKKTQLLICIRNYVLKIHSVASISNKTIKIIPMKMGKWWLLMREKKVKLLRLDYHLMGFKEDNNLISEAILWNLKLQMSSNLIVTFISIVLRDNTSVHTNLYVKLWDLVHLMWITDLKFICNHVNKSLSDYRHNCLHNLSTFHQ